MKIDENLPIIKANINSACQKCGRNPKDVMILAVTKTVDADTINHAVELGLTNLGENRVQELLQKYDSVDRRAVWHLIGVNDTFCGLCRTCKGDRPAVRQNMQGYGRAH